MPSWAPAMTRLTFSIARSVERAIRDPPCAFGSIWLRRAAILSQLKAGDRTDTALLRDCIEPNLGDTTFWIRKAIGWALRSHARTDPDWVRTEVERCGDRISGLSRREALKHLDGAPPPAAGSGQSGSPPSID